jgi:hypothetical protein
VRCMCAGTRDSGSEAEAKAGPESLVAAHSWLFLGNAYLRTGKRGDAGLAYKKALRIAQSAGAQASKGSLVHICRDNYHAWMRRRATQLSSPSSPLSGSDTQRA